MILLLLDQYLELLALYYVAVLERIIAYSGPIVAVIVVDNYLGNPPESLFLYI